MRRPLVIQYMTLQLLHSEFPYTVYEENLIFFFISVVWMHWSCIGQFVIGFKTIGELYPSSPLEIDSVDTSQGEEFAWTIPIHPNNPARQ